MVIIVIKAIIYNSHTGFTKQYAYHFAINTGLPIYDIKEAKKKLNKGDEIIYFSWLKANKITKLNKMKNYKIAYIAAVGMSFYNDDLISDIKKINKFENIYYLQGGIRWRMLNTFERILMKMILASLRKKNKKNLLNAEDKVFYDRLNNGYEIIDLNSLNHLIMWYNSSNELIS